MVYAAAYNNGKAVSYLISSDYRYDQKDWVSANSLDFITSEYANVYTNLSGKNCKEVNTEKIEISTNVVTCFFF